MKKRKGTVIDILFIVVFMMAFAICTILAMYLSDKIYVPLQEFFGPGDASTTLGVVNNTIGSFDYIFLFLFFGMCLAPIVFSFLIQTHPIFFLVNLLMLVVMFLIMPTLSNTVRAVWAAPELAQYAAGGGGSHTFPIMTYIFKYLPLITCGISLIITVAMFVKPREL
jgi:hypothetical protein